MTSTNSKPQKYMPNDDEIYVVNRLEEYEALDYNKITDRIHEMIDKPFKINKINTHEIVKIIIQSIKPGIKTQEIDDLICKECANLSLNNPDYLIIAGRLAVNNHRKNTINSFHDKMKLLYTYKDSKGKCTPVISREFFKYVEKHQEYIESLIDYNRDYLIDYFGLKTFIHSYSLKINDKAIERPQDLFMRTAISLAMNSYANNDYNTPEEYEINVLKELDLIKKTYEALSNKYYTHASPTYYNAGTNHTQYSSCFLLGTEDSQIGIMETEFDMGIISTLGGGLGVHVNSWRGKGRTIRGTNGVSGGIVPILRIYNNAMRAWNQGGKRKGSAAIYIMPHHPEIVEFLKLKSPNTPEEERADDLFYALWIPDLFMERVQKGEMWSLFDPDETEDLSLYYGDEYRKKYIEYENKKMYTKQIKARDLWEKIYIANTEKGVPYLCSSDNVNKANMHNNIGAVPSSNLCAEITLFSNHKETAVCNLSSISLPAFIEEEEEKEEINEDVEKKKVNEDVEKKEVNEKEQVEKKEVNEDVEKKEVNEKEQVEKNTSEKVEKKNVKEPRYIFNFKKLREIVKLIVINLNLIIDKNYYPTPKTRLSNMRHRPVGIGIQGLADVFMKMGYDFDSEEAKKLNVYIMETIYYAALSQSSKMCKDKVFNPETKTYEVVGPYPSMRENGGSHISHGIFHWELCGLKPENLSGMYDWETLRAHIKKFGVRNSHLVALMPTASTSQLLGNNECFEPYTANIYKRKTLSGEFIIINKWLINDLKKLGIWNEDIKNIIIASEGSVQYIDNLPIALKNRYKTAAEINQSVLIQLAIDRQPFVDQSQSLNWYVNKLTLKEFTNLSFQAWKGGLKTMKYYVHTSPAITAQKFTIPFELQQKMLNLTNEQIHKSFQTLEKNECELCGS